MEHSAFFALFCNAGNKKSLLQFNAKRAYKRKILSLTFLSDLARKTVGQRMTQGLPTMRKMFSNDVFGAVMNSH